MKFCLFVCVLVVWLGCSTGSLQKGSEYSNSLGQEVLEIRSPIKDLPPDLEEEPSAESDSGEEVFSRTTTTIPPATKKEIASRKSGGGVLFQNRRGKPKDIEKIDNVHREDDEAKIEKELADIYKDPDYNLASSEEALKNAKQNNNTANVNKTVSKPVVRNQNTIIKETKVAHQNTVYQFQPTNLADKTEVERFRTSIDEVKCDKSVTKLANAPVTSNLRSSSITSYNVNQVILCYIVTIAIFVICH